LALCRICEQLPKGWHFFDANDGDLQCSDGGGGRADPNDTGKALQVSFEVENPQVFTARWTATVTYRRDLEAFTERVCRENLHNYGVAVDPMAPTSVKSDF